MRGNNESNSLMQFDLLPPSFHYQIRLRQLRCSWLLTVLILGAVLCGVTAATVLRRHRDQLTHQRIAAAAAPLIELRRDVFSLQEQIESHEKHCRRVEAAKPDDSGLQTLAAIAAASQTGTRDIIVDTLQLRLPIEYPASAKEPPSWALPHLEISARILGDAEEPWIDRLNSFDRIESASVVTNQFGGNGEGEDDFRLHLESYPVRVTAIPNATRVLP